MAKDTVAVVDTLPEGSKIVERDLAYTGAYYKDLVASSTTMRKKMFKFLSPKEISEMYGIYYNAIAGLIRSGALCRRENGQDGFPEIHVIIGDSVYKARESVLCGILGDEAPDLIKPYEDHFESYVDPDVFLSPIINRGSGGDLSGSGEKESDKIKKLNASHRAAIDDLKKKNRETVSKKDKEIERLKGEIGKKDKELQEKDGEIRSLSNDVKTKEEALEKASTSPADFEPVVVPNVSSDDLDLIPLDDDERQELSQKLSEAMSQIEDMAKENDKLKSENEKLKKKGTTQETIFKKKAAIYEDELKKKDDELTESKKYVYDPNYDHYYSDELPRIIEGLEIGHSYFIAKVIAIGLCCIGMVGSLLLFV